MPHEGPIGDRHHSPANVFVRRIKGEIPARHIHHHHRCNKFRLFHLVPSKPIDGEMQPHPPPLGPSEKWKKAKSHTVRLMCLRQLPAFKRSWKASLEASLSPPVLRRADWDSSCEMIFAVIKGSHSAELTVVMESRMRLSSPNSLTCLPAAACSNAGTLGSASRELIPDLISPGRPLFGKLVWLYGGNE